MACLIDVCSYEIVNTCMQPDQDFTVESLHFLLQIETTMGDESVETLGSEIRFSSVLDTFSPLPPKQC